MKQNNVSYQRKAAEKALYFHTNLLKHKVFSEENFKVAVMFL